MANRGQAFGFEDLLKSVEGEKKGGNDGGRRQPSAMSAVYGQRPMPDPMAGRRGQRNSSSSRSGQPQSPSARMRPASPATSSSPARLPSALKSPGSPRQRPEPLRRESDPTDEGARLQEDAEGGADEDDNDNPDDADTDNDERVRGRGRIRSSRSPSGSRSVSREGGGEPTLTVTGPDGEKTIPRRGSVHPNTSFDQGASGISTPINSDTEADITDIRHAQKLNISYSAIHSSPEAHRVIRQVIRGNYAMFQREADQGLRRQRVYLVATDLSEEAAYALEWTIGTVLRDGDTLLAVYVVDEETGTGGEASSVEIGEGASAVKDTASIVGALPQASESGSAGPSPLGNARASSKAPEIPTMSKAERERRHAAQEVCDRCVKLLRKTRLQVRVIVEVFHCKSPKHMITEVIDFLEPTLVILGSRGRSALKGVLLGSFSNYLVTKSSVPVMVARKRLRKHSKYRRTNLRLSNMLTNPNANSTLRFANAKVDELGPPPGSAEAEKAEKKKKRKEQELQEALALIPR
ncbi:MAG: hypothetical protein M1820_000246 [Bogoriella megaspora]|nr:MAG: hypothetical protein M1820_000246 [Bogoriella megaspora]